jgi:hypothetical protein
LPKLSALSLLTTRQNSGLFKELPEKNNFTPFKNYVNANKKTAPAASFFIKYLFLTLKQNNLPGD